MIAFFYSRMSFGYSRFTCGKVRLTLKSTDGGIYSWQPSKRQWKSSTPSERNYQSLSQDGSQPSSAHVERVPEGQHQASTISRRLKVFWTGLYHVLPPCLIVIIGTAAGMTVLGLYHQMDGIADTMGRFSS